MLWNDNGEQAVLHSSSDAVLIDTRWEGEASRKFSDAALRDPELGFGLLGLSGFFFVGEFGGSALSSTFVLDASFVSLVAIRILDGTLGRSVLDEAGRGCSGGVATFGAAFDGQGVGIGKFDLDILLLDSREFAMQFVSVLAFLDVELGGECLQGGADVAVTLAAVLIEVVEHAKEWLEGGVRGVGGDEWTCKERHLAFGCCGFE